MMTVYLSILAGALLVLGYIMYLGRLAHKDTDSHKQSLLEWEEEQERKKIAQLRQEKRRQEKLRHEEERQRQKVRAEIRPLLQHFINQHMNSQLACQFEFIGQVLQGKTIEMHELLQHNVNRTFADGRPYRVGLARQVNNSLVSLQPEELEQLQLYFVNLIELLTLVKSKGLVIDVLSLQDMIESEYTAQAVQGAVEAL